MISRSRTCAKLQYEPRVDMLQHVMMYAPLYMVSWSTKRCSYDKVSTPGYDNESMAVRESTAGRDVHTRARRWGPRLVVKTMFRG